MSYSELVAKTRQVNVRAMLTLSWPAVSHSTHLTGGPCDRGTVITKLSLIQENAVMVYTTHHYIYRVAHNGTQSCILDNTCIKGQR